MKLNDIWPCSVSRLTGDTIRRLSEEDFYELCCRVHVRARIRNGNDRQADKLVRRLIRRRRGPTMASRFPGLPPAMILAKYAENDILNEFVTNREKKWVHPTKRLDLFDYTLTDLSFVDTPEDTLRQLYDVAKIECTSRDGILNFGDAQIRDIGPYIVLGLMRKGMVPFVRGGTMEVPVQKVIEAVRLREFMKMQPFPGLSERDDVWAFKLRERNAGPSSTEPAKSYAFSLVADELVDTINEWIGALPIPLTLMPNAKQHLNKIVTEILDNAERHGQSGEIVGDWHVAGFMARRETQSQDDAYDCHIAFVNTGITIADNIQRISDGRLRYDLSRYVEMHRTGSGQSSATLATLYAMQDGVSSLPAGRGGLGMMEMVEMANRLGKTNHLDRQPEVTVISGNSCIRFADEFRDCHKREDGGRVQFFNKEFDVEFPPDRHNVFDMRHAYPGTIVAMRFSLDCQAQMQTADSE